eukprot:GDKJ01059336.1.p1 GENE.GDKJ01059336.1~~GDKJ01059336.1.p1  ORF type:complete len:210 (-),score=59.93 GDKJ01059336.1:46-675(-)
MAAAASSTPSASQASSLMHRRVDEVLRSWESKVNTQVQSFSVLADSVVKADTDLLANVKSVEQLCRDFSVLSSRQGSLEQSIEHVVSQQDALSDLLDAVEASLAISSSVVTNNSSGDLDVATNSANDSFYRRARHLISQLEEVELQTGELFSRLGNAMPSSSSGSGSTDSNDAALVLNVMSNHQQSLCLLSNEVENVTKRLQNLEKVIM